jgi:hypothetical protein
MDTGMDSVMVARNVMMRLIEFGTEPQQLVAWKLFVALVNPTPKVMSVLAQNDWMCTNAPWAALALVPLLQMLPLLLVRRRTPGPVMLLLLAFHTLASVCSAHPELVLARTPDSLRALVEDALQVLPGVARYAYVFALVAAYLRCLLEFLWGTLCLAAWLTLVRLPRALVRLLLRMLPAASAAPTPSSPAPPAPAPLRGEIALLREQHGEAIALLRDAIALMRQDIALRREQHAEAVALGRELHAVLSASTPR